MSETEAVLELKELESGYGKKQVLYGISMAVRRGEIVAVIGPNGAGKSTILNVILGLLPAWKGGVILDGVLLKGLRPAERVSAGITLAPQGSRVFTELSVLENMKVAASVLPKKEQAGRIEAALHFFPVLGDRREEIAGHLSGGEQQMLAISRALVPRTKLLMLDEPSLGLSPSNTSEVFEKIVEINFSTKTAILIVEQKVKEVLRICHKVYSFKLGRVAYEGLPVTLQNDPKRLKALFL